MRKADSLQATEKHRLRVKLVRGPFVELSAHERSCDDTKSFADLCSELSASGALLAADLFCGAGGLSLGLEQAGFAVVLGVDTFPEALETHRHYFPGLTLDWDLSDEDRIEAVADLITRAGITVVCGGPPCQPFSRAGRSLLRELVRTGRRPAHDERRDLWQSFLQIVRLSRPEAVLFENVPEVALDRDMLILRTLVAELEEMGYSVKCDILETWRWGVPQFRQRFILVALKEGLRFTWPEADPLRVLVRHAIEDLPPVEGGWRPDGGAEGSSEYAGPRYSFQERMRRDVPAGQSDRVYDHITRPVRDDDAAAFELMDSSTSYKDLPAELKRYRDDIFDDKYKRLDWDDLSRTITAHIAKDGYWYIHPEQNRTLTIREAARLQTFPDHVRFAGPPSKTFRQIGNAVPPILAERLGREILSSLSVKERAARTPTRLTSRRLAEWLVDEIRSERPVTPWFRSALEILVKGETPGCGLRWPVLLGELLLRRASVPGNRLDRAWKALEKEYPEPRHLLEASEVLRSVAFGVGREKRVAALLDLAGSLATNGTALEEIDELTGTAGVSRDLAELAFTVVPGSEADPVSAPQATLRVAARFTASTVDTTNRQTAGRVAIARLIGVDDETSKPDVDRSWGRWQSSLARIALLELGRWVCTPSAPHCDHCPLAPECESRESLSAAAGQLEIGV